MDQIVTNPVLTPFVVYVIYVLLIGFAGPTIYIYPKN